MKTKGYDISLIRRYLKGELDGPAMYKLERQAQQDPLLMDLITGMESGSEEEHQQALAGLDILISQRTGGRKENKIIAWRKLSIAASLIIGLSVASFFVLQNRPSQQLAKQDEPKAPGNKTSGPALPDTLSTSGDEPPVATDAPKEQENTVGRAKKNKPAQVATEPPVMANTGEIQFTTAIKPVDSTSGSIPFNPESGSTNAIGNVKPANLEGLLAGRVAGLNAKASRSSSRAKDSLVVSGTVRDKTSQEALAGAIVRAKNQDHTAVTDENGKFRIALQDKNQTLESVMIGYEIGQVKVGGKDSVSIAMKPMNTSLNEVMIAGYGRPDAKSLKTNDSLAHAMILADNKRKEFMIRGLSTSKSEAANLQPRPLDGWKNFEKYLSEHTKVGKKDTKGTVVLSFRVAADGKISDVRVVQGINPRMDRRALDLLLNGPRWIGIKDMTKETTLRVEFP